MLFLHVADYFGVWALLYSQQLLQAEFGLCIHLLHMLFQLWDLVLQALLLCVNLRCLPLINFNQALDLVHFVALLVQLLLLLHNLRLVAANLHVEPLLLLVVVGQLREDLLWLGVELQLNFLYFPLMFLLVGLQVFAESAHLLLQLSDFQQTGLLEFALALQLLCQFHYLEFVFQVLTLHFFQLFCLILQNVVVAELLSEIANAELHLFVRQLCIQQLLFVLLAPLH